MFHQILFSPQVKRCVICSNKHGIYVLSRLKISKAAGGQMPTQEKKKFYKIIQHDINIFFQGDKCFPRRNLTAAYGFEISTPVWVKNKRKSKLKN